jgi:hypothetical protein
MVWSMNYTPLRAAMTPLENSGAEATDAPRREGPILAKSTSRMHMSFYGVEWRRSICWVALAAMAVGGSTSNARAEPVSHDPPAQGSFSLLTYNVAGLPIFISQSAPYCNMPEISTLLNLYDVAVVQEDFAYHDLLCSRAKHPYQSPALVLDAKVGIGDGLNVFSRLPISSFERITWRACNGRFSDGSDCLAPKGFTFAVQELAPGVSIDLYDLHMDSGDAAADVAARAQQAEQLLAFIEHRSAEHAVIVAGDTNMGRESEQILQGILKRAALTDACRTLSCSRPNLIDRVLYRSSAAVALRATNYLIDKRFVRAEDGEQLSDHWAVGVVMQWSRERRVAALGAAPTVR